MEDSKDTVIYLFEYLCLRINEHNFRRFQFDRISYIKRGSLQWIGNCNKPKAGYAADRYTRMNGMSAFMTLMGVGELSALNAIAGAFAEYGPVIHIISMPSRSSQLGQLGLHHTLGDGDVNVFGKMGDAVSCMTITPISSLPHLFSLIRSSRHALSKADLSACSSHLIDLIHAPVSSRRLQGRLDMTVPANDGAAETGLVAAIMRELTLSQKTVLLIGGYAIRHDMRQILSLVEAFAMPTITSTSERCTTLLGVPTMFVAELETNRTPKYSMATLRKAMAAGSPVPLMLMESLQDQFGIQGMANAYGMTGISTGLRDSPDDRAQTVGRVMPHVRAKVVDSEGQDRSTRRERRALHSGYTLQKGYLHNESKTREVMKADEEGTVWMHTEDECIIDGRGDCHVMGRIKDLIIRGGENIFPAEIQDQPVTHPFITKASVVGVSDARYGEVVGCLLKIASRGRWPSTEEIQDWVQSRMGTAKTPQWVLWVGADGVYPDFPNTGSGKHQKHVLRKWGTYVAMRDA